MSNIDKIYKMLEWDNEKSVQNMGIKLAKEIENLDLFFQPINLQKNVGKNVWENCAKIVSNNSNEKLEKYIYKMLEWIEDLTWPGADIIFDRLKKFDYNVLLSQLNISIEKAINDGRSMLLRNMSELVRDYDQKNKLKKIASEIEHKEYIERKKWIKDNKEVLIKNLESDDESVKVLAIDFLNQLGDQDTDKILLKFKNDRNNLFRVYAEEAEKRLNNR